MRKPFIKRSLRQPINWFILVGFPCAFDDSEESQHGLDHGFSPLFDRATSSQRFDRVTHGGPSTHRRTGITGLVLEPATPTLITFMRHTISIFPWTFMTILLQRVHAGTVLTVYSASGDAGPGDSDEVRRFRPCSDLGRLSFVSTTRRTRSAACATAADGFS